MDAEIVDMMAVRRTLHETEIKILKDRIAQLEAGYEAIRQWPLFNAPEQGSIQMWDPRWLRQIVFKAVGK